MSTEVIDGVEVEVTNTEVGYEAGAEIDGDGAPNCYALPGSGLVGLDSIRNAMRDPSDSLALDEDGRLIQPAHGWVGIVCDASGVPKIQQSGQFMGYCISPTALVDKTCAVDDVRRYVDATLIPYISIPPQLEALGVHLGDGCLVADRDTGRSVQAIVADVGPRRRLGEISVACAEALGIPSSPRSGGAGRGVIVRIFLGSAKTPTWSYQRTAADVAALVDAFSSQT